MSAAEHRRADSRDPLIALRVPEALNDALRARARATDSTLSAVIREALEAHLAAPGRDQGITRPAPRTKHASMCPHRVRSGSYCNRCDALVA